MTQSQFSKGLQGTIAAQSAICQINGEQGKLYYRGYPIEELCENAIFEEVIWLLWYGELPTKPQLTSFQAALAKEMDLPPILEKLISLMPPNVNPMDALRTCVSALASLDPHYQDNSTEQNKQRALRIIARFPPIIAAIQRRIEEKKPLKLHQSQSYAAAFLSLLSGESPTKEQEHLMNVLLILHAEHELNASTFAARVTVATLSDMYSGIVSAIGTLKGPLHGGATSEAIEAWHRLAKEYNIKHHCDTECQTNMQHFVQTALANKEKIMGIGHRVYKVKDPRAKILEKFASKVKNIHYYQMAKVIETVIAKEKNLYPNVDFFSGIVYEELKIKPQYYTSIFALARIAGWIAHILEQYADNRLIRPLSEYTGHPPRSYPR